MERMMREAGDTIGKRVTWKHTSVAKQPSWASPWERRKKRRGKGVTSAVWTSHSGTARRGSEGHPRAAFGVQQMQLFAQWLRSMPHCVLLPAHGQKVGEAGFESASASVLHRHPCLQTTDGQRRPTHALSTQRRFGQHARRRRHHLE